MKGKARSAPAGESRFIVGIDLGTTNSVVAFADTSAPAPGPHPTLQVLALPQLTAANSVEARPLLPSFLYLPAAGEFPANALRLPWDTAADFMVGEFARMRGAEVPARLIASAKSWLSYAGADRTAAILPWGSPDDVRKLSPVEASARYLSHMRQAWNATFAEAPLEEQEVLLTVPASFDAVARDLTVRAAHDAGLPQVTLLEEPQAAFYAWIDANGDAWRQSVRVGDVVLVCDIGGGTTDFSLIAVREEHGELVLERVAVGDHILLGGDNMDLALAYALRERLSKDGTQLDQWQFRSLSLSCRDAKERLLSGGKQAKHPIAILGRGRKVVGGSLRVDVELAEVEHTLIDGFFPRCELSDRPQAQRRVGLQEIGLPYASDAAVTRHLAHFLGRHGEAVSRGGDAAVRPTAVLFNGGVMRATMLHRRLVDVLNGWFQATSAEGVRVLTGGDPEHAVARGAAYYGLARRGRGVRIRGGTARAYYIGIETAMPAVPGVRPPIKALCVVPYGLEEGSSVDLPAQELGLVVGEPAEFRFLGSATRRDDAVGTFVEAWDNDIQELAPLETALEWKGQEGATIPVRLQARVTEVGVLELWCVSRDGEHRWKLEFNVRSNA
ncbi:MAG TPA: Hsp70 family protein [Candidatus Acidoferrales bacterium]|nr:Hsp70 family protein [Candidatus Acidoferrales bacterium]